MLTTLKPAYDQHRPLSKEKADDLRKLLKYVPPIYHPFYTTKTSRGVLPSFNEVLDEHCSDSENISDRETETPSTTRRAVRSSTTKKDQIREHQSDTVTLVTTRNGGKTTRRSSLLRLVHQQNLT